MADNEQLKGKAISNMIWRLAERTGAQGVAFVVSIVLARFLAPDAYGTVALLMVFTTILIPCMPSIYQLWPLQSFLQALNKKTF